MPFLHATGGRREEFASPARSSNLPISHRGWTVALLLVGCIACTPSQRAHQPEDGDPFARLRNRTAVVGYEFGTCTTDAQCVPQGCNAAVCSPHGESGTCADSMVGECLASMPPQLCGCFEGVCRWTRTDEVNLCAQLAWDKPLNRPFSRDRPGTYFPTRLTP